MSDWKLLLGSVLVALTLLGSQARADAEGEARTRYERALRLYEDGVYDAALVELHRAYELHPFYKVLYNIAQVRVALQDYAGAVEAFQQYLRDGGGQVPAQRVEAVRKELSRLEQRVGRLTVESDVPGAEVLVDDTLVGTTPLSAPVLVSSGMRRVTVRHPDHGTQSQRVSLAGGEQRKVSLPLTAHAASTPATTAAGEPTPSAPPTAPSASATALPEARPQQQPVAAREPAAVASTQKRTRWIAWGTTAAIALSAVGTAVGAAIHDGSLSETRDQPVSDVGSFRDEATKTDRLALATDILTGAAVVSAGISLWLTLRKAPVRERTRTNKTRLAAHPRGLSLHTEF